MPYTAQATKEELRKGYKKCWCPDCKKSAWFQGWSGWNWCWKHAIREIKINETLSGKWFEFKNMKIRNPYNYPFN